MAVDIHADQT